MPDKKEFMALRDGSNEGFMLFMTNVVSHVHGRVDFKANAPYKNVSDLVSVSTEAFALFILEGNYERWIYEFKHADDKDMMALCPKPKYVNHGASRKGEGYTKMGLMRLCCLGCAVATDRESTKAPRMEENYRMQAQKQFQSETSKKRKKRETELNKVSGIEEAMLMLEQQAKGIYTMPRNLENILNDTLSDEQVPV